MNGDLHRQRQRQQAESAAHGQAHAGALPHGALARFAHKGRLGRRSGFSRFRALPVRGG